jgi:hypothetical protein
VAVAVMDLTAPHLAASEAARRWHLRCTEAIATAAWGPPGADGLRAVLEADYVPTNAFPAGEGDLVRFACAHGVGPAELERTIRWACLPERQLAALASEFPGYQAILSRPHPPGLSPYPLPCRHFVGDGAEAPDGRGAGPVLATWCHNPQHSSVRCIERLVQCKEDGVPTPGVAPYGFTQWLLNQADLSIDDLGDLGARVRREWPDMQLS